MLNLPGRLTEVAHRVKKHTDQSINCNGRPLAIGMPIALLFHPSLRQGWNDGHWR